MESVKNSQKQKRVSHAFHRAWKSGQNQERRISTFPPRRRRVEYKKEEKRDGTGTEFQLTEGGCFKHYSCASVATLRS